MKRIELLVVLLHVSQHASGVEVFDGEESVQLPCQVNISVSKDSTVHWSREDLKYSIVHIRQQTRDDLMDQNKRYRNRTSMKMDALQTGDLSLTLKNPTISDSETYTCTVRRFGEELSRIDVLLEVKERFPPILLPVVLVSLVLLASVSGLFFYLRYKRMKHNPDSQVEVESGVESVQLPCKTTNDLSEHAKVEWRDGTGRKVHVYPNSSDQEEEQHWWYRGRTEMKKNLETGDLSLTLKYPTDRDSCTYTCIVYSKEGDSLMEKQVELTVKVPQVDDEEGAESVHLPCRATGHLSEDVTVEWTCVDIWITKVHVFQNGSDQLEEQHKSYRGRTEMKKDLLETGDLSLTLKRPTDRDNYCYTCTVCSGEGNILMQKQVKIRVKVRQLEAEEGEKFVLLPFRTTPDLPEDAQVKWWRYDPEPPMTVLKCQNGCEQRDQQDQFYRGRTEIPKYHLKTGVVSLTLKYPTDRDTGRYICSLTSTTVSRKKTVLLQVVNRQIDVEEGAESVQLPFRTTAGLPKDTRVEWIRYEPQHMKVHVYQNGSEHPEDQNSIYKDRTEMNEDPLESGELTLTLKQPKVGDSGTYRCEVCSREEKCRRETTVVLRVSEAESPDDVGMEGLPLIPVR